MAGAVSSEPYGEVSIDEDSVLDMVDVSVVREGRKLLDG